MHVGDGILLSPIDDSVHVDLGGYYKWLSGHAVKTMMGELGVPIKKNGWTSCEHDGWKIDEGMVVFETTIGTATPNPVHYEKSIPVEVMAEQLAQLTCIHKSTNDAIELKNCRYCLFWRYWAEGRCLYPLPSPESIGRLDPLKLILDSIDKHVTEVAYNGWDWGEVKASMRFRVTKPDIYIPNVWDQLKFGLQSHRNVNGMEYIKHYEFKGLVCSTIELDEQEKTGIITSSESHELHGKEDWWNLKGCLGDKVFHVLRAFAEVCYYTDGHVEAIPKENKKGNGNDAQ